MFLPGVNSYFQTYLVPRPLPLICKNPASASLIKIFLAVLAETSKAVVASDVLRLCFDW